MPDEASFLQVENVTRAFDVSRSWLHRAVSGQKRQFLKAVDGVTFSIRRGETLGLVGESGCGKSTVARLIVGLYPVSGGSIQFDGQEISRLSGFKAQASVRRRVQMIFQDPYASLNPRWRVRNIIAEPLWTHQLVSRNAEARHRVDELLRQVGLAPPDGDRFPHEFSGGQRQRIAIARALASNPDLLVCDEPTSALDVSVQAQIINLMLSLQDELDLTYLFISHNLSVVRYVSDYAGVMYLGRLVEIGPAQRVFSSPQHPYTQMLIDAVPDLDTVGTNRATVTGEVPNPLDPPSGCAFHPRCRWANHRCREERPELAMTSPLSQVACHAVFEGRLPASSTAPRTEGFTGMISGGSAAPHAMS